MPRIVHERADTFPLIAEVFREFGYEGTSYSRITGATGLSKGSLYHFFPGGKEEMAAVLLTEIHDWFESNVFAQLTSQEPDVSIRNMWAATGRYFFQGERICLMGAFALDQTRNRFSSMIRRYFSRWIETLQNALIRGGMKSENAAALAEAAVGNIQGALILARALDDPKFFERALHRLEAEIHAGINNSTP